MFLPTRMLMRVAKIFLAIALSFTFTLSLWKIIICAHEKYFNEFDAVDNWLDENSLGLYKGLFRELGKLAVLRHSTCHRTHILDTNINNAPS